jgi:hypothetical protein
VTRGGGGLDAASAADQLKNVAALIGQRRGAEQRALYHAKDALAVLASEAA